MEEKGPIEADLVIEGGWVLTMVGDTPPLEQAKIVVKEGKIVQIGKPSEIYSAPANKFVAGFMGTTTFIHGKVAGLRGERFDVQTDSGLSITGRGRDLARGDEVDVAIRPENIRFLTGPEAPAGQGKGNIFEARIIRASYVGELVDYQLDLKGSLLRAKGETADPMTEGTMIRIHIEPEQLSILKA